MTPALPQTETEPSPAPRETRAERQARRGRAKPADLVPPFLIKELRQSLRSRRFVRTFFGLQVLLLGVILLELIAAGGFGVIPEVLEDWDANMLTGIFWAVVAIPIIAVPPLTIMGTLPRMQRNRSLELVLLTDLTAWRAVLGMWAGFLCEAALLTTAALPYLMLRYFIGGVDLVREFFCFLLILVFSSVFSAMAMGLTIYRHWTARIFIVLLALGLGFISATFLTYFFVEFDVSTLVDWRWVVLFFVILPAWAHAFLRICANHLCAPAESHSAHIRVSLLVILIAAGATMFGSDIWSLHIVLIACTPLLTETLCDPFRAVEPLYRSRGPLATIRRLAGRVFYAGWPAGVRFLLLYYLVYLGLAHLHLAVERSSSSWVIEYEFPYSIALMTGHAATLFLATAWVRLRHPLKDPTQPYFGMVFMLQLIVMMLFSVFWNWSSADFAQYLIYLAPLAGGIYSTSGRHEELAEAMVSWVYPCVTGIAFLLLNIVAKPHWRVIRALERGQPAPPDTRALPPGYTVPED